MVKIPQLSTQPLKGMNDFPPLILDKYQAINNVIHRVAHQLRYREYDLPILESWETFAVKSATEILEEQSYHFIDRGGRRVLLRPEITPALARLVAKEIKQLPQPVRWYTIGRCFRYERPQKGRFREFRQLNFDIFGKKNFLYDIEILRVVKKIMDSFNVPPSKYAIRYNHRGIVNLWLRNKGFSKEESKHFFTIVDRKNKLTQEEFNVYLKEYFKDHSKHQVINDYFIVKDLSELFPTNSDIVDEEMTKNVRDLLNTLNTIGKKLFDDTLVFDPQIVRGFDYYTGLVFEVSSQEGEIRRSLFGGGRYDNLIDNYLKENISGIGFGMGIDIFILFLESLGIVLPPKNLAPGYYIAPITQSTHTNDAEFNYSFEVGEKLLQHGFQVENAPPAKLSKHFNRIAALNNSNNSGVPFSGMIIIGSDEVQTQTCTIKHLENGNQQTVALKDLIHFITTFHHKFNQQTEK